MRAILAIDIGGSKVKALASGQTEPRKAESGGEFTPSRLVEVARALAEGWEYEAVSIGYPGPVGDSGPMHEPGNLGTGWVGFDYAAAFERPVKIVNDAVMQALGSYEGGRMLFLGLGTGLGSALIGEGSIVPLELGRLPFEGGSTLGERVGNEARKRQGDGPWGELVHHVVSHLVDAFLADDVVIGGGNAKKLERLPPGVRLGHNLTAFRGGFRLWEIEDIPVQEPGHGTLGRRPEPEPSCWRLI